MQIKLLILYILLTVSGQIAAETNNDQLVQELYVKSGVKKQLDELPGVVEAQFQAQLKHRASTMTIRFQFPNDTAEYGFGINHFYTP